MPDRPVTRTELAEVLKEHRKDFAEMLLPMAEEIHQTHTSVHGNGQPGLKTNMAVIGARAMANSKFIWLIIGGGVAMFIKDLLAS